MTVPVWATLVGIALATFAGPALQRIAGMGLGLIAAPALSVLLITVGVLLLAALSVVTLGKRYVPNIEGTVPAIAAGAVGGFMNTLAGVAGPAVTVYAHAARWPKDIYAATLQPIFLVGGVLSFAVKVLTGAADFTAVTAGVWGAGSAGMLAGMVAGKRIAPLVSPARGYSLALALAVFGGATVLARGIVGATF